MINTLIYRANVQYILRRTTIRPITCSTLHAFTMVQWSPSHGSYCLQSRIVNNGVLTFLAGIQFCHDIAINPTSQNFLWIGGSRPPDPRLPQASSTGPPPAIAQFKRGAKTVGAVGWSSDLTPNHASKPCA